MKISVVASTMDYDTLKKLFEENGATYEYIKTKWNDMQKESFDKFGGKAGGICYMPDTWETLDNESDIKSLRRAEMTKEGGHHSVHAHAHVSLIIENCSKMMAMILNNEHAYVTSEKSARYTKMTTEGKTKELYEKWNDIFKDILDTNHPELDEKKRKKLAMENARYLIGVFNPSTIMMYSTSYRQLNYIYYWAKDLSEKNTNLPLSFYNQLKPELESFVEQIERTGLIDPKLRDDKNRSFSLFNYVPVENHFGTSYEVEYLASLAALAQLHRHKTVYYNCDISEEYGYYIPPMIKNNPKLVEMWIKDMKSLSHTYPQGMLVKVAERGTKEMALLKAKERKCFAVQKEANDLTTDLLVKYYEATKDNPSTFYDDIRNIASTGFKSRCVWGYKCSMPCKNKDGINNTRDY